MNSSDKGGGDGGQDRNGTSLPLWYIYPECAVAPYGFFFYYGVKVLNLALGAPCNLLVIWHIASRKSNGITADIFFLNLAVLDAYFCLMTPIDLVNQLILGSRKVLHFQLFAYGVKDSAPLFLMCICLDRYVAVVHPVTYSRAQDNRLRAVVSALVWGLVLGFGVAKSLVPTVLVHNKLFTTIVLLALAMMVFSNVSIMWVLRRLVAGKEKIHPVKKKAFQKVVILLAINVVNYLPAVALMPFVERYSFVDYFCKIKISVFLLMDLSSSIEPVIYLHKMEGSCGCCGRQAQASQTEDKP